MKRMSLLVLLLAPLSAGAATLMEVSNDQGGIDHIWIEGEQARMESSRMPGHIVIDLKDGTMVMVDPDQRQAVEMTPRMGSGGSDAVPAGVRLEELGRGPAIAGYPTRRYSLHAADRNCGELFLSNQALELEDLARFAEAMQQIDTGAGQFGAMVDPCIAAQSAVAEQIADAGIPLRTVHEGRVVSEVQRIDTDADLPADAFVVPSDYDRINMQQLMEEAMRRMQQQGGAAE